MQSLTKFSDLPIEVVQHNIIPYIGFASMAIKRTSHLFNNILSNNSWLSSYDPQKIYEELTKQGESQLIGKLIAVWIKSYGNKIKTLNLDLDLTNDQILTITKGLEKYEDISISTLNLSRKDFDDNEYEEIGLINLISTFKKITSLNISGRSELENFSLPEEIILKSLNCYGCNNLSQAAIENILKKCTKLENLDLSYCDKIINNKIYKIISQIPLECLSLLGHKHLSDEGIKDLASIDSLRRFQITCNKIVLPNKLELLRF